MYFDRFIKLIGDEISVILKGDRAVLRFIVPYRNEKGGNMSQELKSENLNLNSVNQDTNMKSILVAEDVDSNFLLLRAFLGKMYILIRANDGLEAVELFKKHKPDLILMDIKMPNMDGLEATKAIREISKDIPIIALTAFAFDNDRQQALSAGCNSFLTNPISKMALLEMLDQYI